MQVLESLLLHCIKKRNKKTGTIKGYKAFRRDVKGDFFTEPASKRTYFKVGNTYSIEGKIEICRNGFHFCRKLKDIFDFYMFSKSIVYCEVEGIAEADEDILESSGKICARKIKIIKKLTFKQVLKILQKELEIKQQQDNFYCENIEAVSDSKYIIDSKAINKSKYIKDSYAVSKSSDINISNVISYSDTLNYSEVVKNGKAISNSKIINDSSFIYGSRIVDNGIFVYGSENVVYSKEIINSNCVRFSNYIKSSNNIEKSYYIIDSLLINKSRYISCCNNIRNCFFCYGLRDSSFHVFNKKVSEKRKFEIEEKLSNILISNNWNLNFTNRFKLMEVKDSSKIALFDFQYYNLDKHFKNFPKEAIKYLKSLPEFDAKIFERITFIKVGE